MYKASAEQMQVLLASIYDALRMYVQTYTRDMKKKNA